MRKLFALTLSLAFLGAGLAIGCGDNQKVKKPDQYAPLPTSGPSGGPAASPAAKPAPGQAPAGAAVPVK